MVGLQSESLDTVRGKGQGVSTSRIGTSSSRPSDKVFHLLSSSRLIRIRDKWEKFTWFVYSVERRKRSNLIGLYVLFTVFLQLSYLSTSPYPLPSFPYFFLTLPSSLPSSCYLLTYIIFLPTSFITPGRYQTTQGVLYLIPDV